MGIKKDAKYNLSFKAANHDGAIKKIIIQFVDKNKKVLGETSIVPTSNDWQNYTAQFTATQTEAKAQLKITFEGTGTIDLDMISLRGLFDLSDKENCNTVAGNKSLYFVKGSFRNLLIICIVAFIKMLSCEVVISPI